MARVGPTEVGQIDPRQPQAGRIEFVRGRQQLRAVPQPVEAGHAGPLHDAGAERLTPFVVVAVEFDAEHPFDESTGVAALDVVTTESFVDAGILRDQMSADALGDEVRVPLEHHRELLVPFEDRSLPITPQRAEQHVGALGELGHRFGVGGVDVAERRVERARVQLERADVFLGDRDQALADPGPTPLSGADRLGDCHRGAHVLGIDGPVLGEAVDVGGDEGDGRCVDRRQGQVEAPERVLREVPDHRPGLGPEEEGSEHPHQPAHPVGAHRHAEDPGGRRLDLLVVRFGEIGRHGLLHRHRQRFEHGPETVEVPARPRASVDDLHGEREHVVEAGLGDDGSRGRVGEFGEFTTRRIGDGFVGATLQGDLLGHLARNLPVERARRLEDPHRFREVDLRKIEGQSERAERVERFGFVSSLRIVGHAVSLGTLMTHSPAAPDAPAVNVAVTGASGLIGSRLVPELVRRGATRVVGLDTRDPERGSAGFEPHLVDVAGHEIETLLTGVDTVVHLAAVVDPIVDDALMARANVEGTRRVLAAAAAVGVRKFVRVSTATVYGAWATNPIPLTEDSPLRPNPGFAPAVHAAEVERLIHEWHQDHPDVVVTILRAAPVLGAGADHLFARLLAGHRRLRIRREGAPVQVVHVDDVVAALALVVEEDHPGVFDVAAPGWLAADDVRNLMPRNALPAVPLDVMRRLLTRSWRSGVGEIPPSVLPYVLHPWVVATDRLESIGWSATHTNEETLLETHESLATAPNLPPKIAAAAAGVAAAGVAVGIAVNRSRRT